MLIQDQNETYGYECLFPCDFNPCGNDTRVDIRDANGTMDFGNTTSGNDTEERGLPLKIFGNKKIFPILRPNPLELTLVNCYVKHSCSS